MSEADKDGRIARALADRMACLSIEISESLRESSEQLKALMLKLDEEPATPNLSATEGDDHE